jgi:hypothetical protein
MECLRISNFRRPWLLVVAFGVILLMTSSSAMATIISPGGGATPLAPGTSVLPNDVTAGTVGTLLAEMTANFNTTASGATVAGSLISAVFDEGDGLDFYYQVVSNNTSNTNINNEANVNFAGWVTGVAYRTDGGSLCGIPGADCTQNGGTDPFTDGTVLPVGADRSLDGITVQFDFVPPSTSAIAPGQTSNVLIIQTDARNYTAGNSGLIFGPTVTVASFEPASGVPEPASLALIGGGLLLLAGFRKYAKR